MMKRVNGIQHLGIGVADHAVAWKWYRKFFGLDIPFFNDEAPAPLMQIYTDGETITKRAAMVLNLQGGCAMEIVQPTSFKATHAKQDFQLGDLGIFIGRVKADNVAMAFEYFKSNGADVVSDIVKLPTGDEAFYVKDPSGLIYQVVKGGEWFTKGKHVTGGIIGCTTGVADADASIKFYGEQLGYDKVISDETGVFADWANLPGGKEKYRRVLLGMSGKSGGGFGRVAGTTFIELVQVVGDRKPVKMYEGRKWGDIGFVHLGFDVKGMAALGEDLAKAGHPFTCDTKDILSMGPSTKVHCTYIEDCDGTLIEMIEVYKIPIVEKWGLFLNVEKRDPEKPLPNYMLKALKFNRIKD